jgi:antitoxin YefM
MIMKTLTMTEAQEGFSDLVRKTQVNKEMFRIHHCEGEAVLMSSEEYDSLLETLELLSIPDFRNNLGESIQQAENGETLSFDEVFGESQ